MNVPARSIRFSTEDNQGDEDNQNDKVGQQTPRRISVWTIDVFFCIFTQSRSGIGELCAIKIS